MSSHVNIIAALSKHEFTLPILPVHVLFSTFRRMTNENDKEDEDIYACLLLTCFSRYADNGEIFSIGEFDLTITAR
jgi:hypothetical protein